MDVCFGSWSLLLRPMERMSILVDGEIGVFSESF